MIWTDDRVQTLTHRWQDGFSASLIGAELGFSRNAIIGKVQRLTLASRKTVVSRRPPRTPRPAFFNRNPAEARAIAAGMPVPTR